MNAPETRLEEIVAPLPNLHAPTVSQLSEYGWVSLETVVDSHLIRDFIPKLPERSVEGILEHDLRKMV